MKILSLLFLNSLMTMNANQNTYEFDDAQNGSLMPTPSAKADGNKGP